MMQADLPDVQLAREMDNFTLLQSVAQGRRIRTIKKRVKDWETVFALPAAVMFTMLASIRGRRFELPESSS